jgi:hypothetical protein
MRTVQLQQADGASEIPERDEILSQNPHPDRKVAQFIGKTDGLPEAAQVFTTRCRGPYVG